MEKENPRDTQCNSEVLKLIASLKIGIADENEENLIY
jgi:hypothetical protein